MNYLLAAVLTLIAVPASAQRAVMENIPATKAVVAITTGTPRIGISTTVYQGSVSNVGMNSSSNVVVSNPGFQDLVVLYATGTVAANQVQAKTLRFADGTTQTTAAGSCGVVQSTQTQNIPTSSITQATLIQSITGSSITLTGVSAGNYAEFCAILPIEYSVAGRFGCTPLLDGALISVKGAGSPTQAAWWAFTATANDDRNVGECFRYKTALTAGSHTASFACAGFTGGGTVTVIGTSVQGENLFRFREVSCLD